MSAMRFELDYGAENPDWDAFVAQCPGAHHEQSTHWGRLKQEQGWKTYRILVRKEDRLVGGAQVQHRRIGRVASFGYICRGPVALSQDQAPAVTQLVVRALRQTAHTYLALLPTYEWQAVVPVLQKHGFFAKPDRMPPSSLVTATTVIDLTQDLETILAKMRRTTRQCVRYGQKGGIEVRVGGEQDLPTFFRLMCQLCARRGLAPHPASVDQFRTLWRFYAAHGMVKLFIGRYQSEDVVAVFGFVFGGSIRLWKGGWSGEHEKLFPNHVLWWEVIRWAKAAGLKLLDIEQILPAHAKAVLRGETINDNYWGVTQYKLGFGGDLLVIPDAYYRSFNPVIQLALKLGGARLMASRLVTKWAGRLARS